MSKNRAWWQTDEYVEANYDPADETLGPGAKKPDPLPDDHPLMVALKNASAKAREEQDRQREWKEEHGW